MEKVGIKELKEAVVFLALLGNGIDQATKDGIQIGDVTYAMPALLKAPEAFSGMDQIPAELKDLDEAEKAEINLAVAQALVLEDKAVEGLVEKAFGALLNIIGIYQDIQKLRA